VQGSSYADYDYPDDLADAIRLEREERSMPDNEEDDDNEDDLLLLTHPTPFTEQRVLSLDEEIEGEEESTGEPTPDIPSSNDTRYLIAKPFVLNLDSKSSRCNKIRTPLDPSKVRLIDNKQMSAVIGCSAGLMIFFCIIISIIIAKPKRHEEEEGAGVVMMAGGGVAKSSSLSESYKSPEAKSRSSSLVDKMGSSSQASEPGFQTHTVRMFHFKKTWHEIFNPGLCSSNKGSAYTARLMS
jgi:hypothetical protein